ncbi:hypothetical protein POTOM_030877 [Populus tomentosa]|uniref:Uncharacterized protein n=1 Tax=Populus tomentosa TaxID=118781 RepID=A0A8X8CR76_POPTO|nr:hypothetical protein POTOM_030877 [Populus tomentosa]
MPELNFRGEYIKLETNDGTVSLPFVHLQILKSGAIVFVEPILIIGEMLVTKGKTYGVSFMLSMSTENSFGWDVPVFLMARIGEKGKHQCVQIDLSELCEKVEEFPLEKCRIEFGSDKKI